MIDPKHLPGSAARPLRRALWLTRVGMVAERLTLAFWPLRRGADGGCWRR